MISSSLRRFSLALMAVFGATACSLVPEQTSTPLPVPAQWPDEVWAHRPEAQVATTAKVGVGETAPASTPTPTPTDNATQVLNSTVASLPPLTESSWREFFTDPILQRAINAALENNRDLAASLARVAEARAQAASVSATLWPALAANAQRSASHTPGTVTGLSGSSAGNGAGITVQRYDVNLSASYELDFWGRARSADAAARATFLASEFAHRAFRINLIADVADAWFSLEEAQQREQLARQIEASRTKSLDLVRQRRDAGLVGDLDFAVAESAWHSARSDLASASRARIFAEDALRTYLGCEIDPAWRPALAAGPGVLSLPTYPAVTVNLPSEALLRRPDVQAAEQRLHAAHVNIAAARAAFLPGITLTASAGTASSALSSLFIAGSGAWTFLPALTVPLFNAGQNQAGLDLAKAREQIAVAEYEKTLQTAFRDVADVLATSRYGVPIVVEIYEAAKAQQNRLAIVEARYRAGVANYLELLDAQRDALAAQQQQVAARRGVQSSAALFFKAVGGI